MNVCPKFGRSLLDFDIPGAGVQIQQHATASHLATNMLL
jgi:hypothetical protein